MEYPALLNWASYGLVLVVNALAGSTNLIGGEKTGEVARQVPTFTDPSPWAFSIWGVIYIGMGVFVWHLDSFLTVFALVACVNVMWLLVWGRKMWLVAEGLLFTYAFLAWQLWREAAPFCATAPAAALLPNIAACFFPAVHFGWLLCACTVSLPLVIKAHFGWQAGPISSVALLALLAAVAIALRNLYIKGVVCWALLAISLHSRNPYSSLVVQACWVLKAGIAVSEIHLFV